MRGIAIREQLTNEWEKQGAKKEKEYAILTAKIADATFDFKPSKHKKPLEKAERLLATQEESRKKNGSKVVSKSNFLDVNPLETAPLDEK